MIRSNRFDRTLALSGALGLTLLVTGCGGESTETAQPPAKTWTYRSGDLGDGPSVYLRFRASAAGMFSLDVMGRALPNVYGLAFRIGLAPGGLVPVGLTLGPSWTPTALSVAREPVPGMLVAGMSERGTAAGFAANDDVLATLDFQLAIPTTSPLTFIDGECAVAQASGGELAGVAWVGGVMELR
jgi:hypothetical protein